MLDMGKKYVLVIPKGRFQQKIKKNGWINPSRLAGWGQPGSKIQPKKKLF